MGEGGILVGGVVVVIRSKLDGDAVGAGEAGLIDDGFVEKVGEGLAKAGHVDVVGLKRAAGDVDVVGRGAGGGVRFWKRRELEGAGDDEELKYGEVLVFDVCFEGEAVLKDREDHGRLLDGGELFKGLDVRVDDLGGEVVALGIERGRNAGNEVWADVVGSFQEALDGGVRGLEGGVADADAVRGVESFGAVDDGDVVGGGALSVQRNGGEG